MTFTSNVLPGSVLWEGWTFNAFGETPDFYNYILENKKSLLLPLTVTTVEAIVFQLWYFLYVQ